MEESKRRWQPLLTEVWIVSLPIAIGVIIWGARCACCALFPSVSSSGVRLHALCLLCPVSLGTAGHRMCPSMRCALLSTSVRLLPAT